MKIFTDSPLSEAAENLLKEGVAPHEVIFPRSISRSVLVKSEPDPRFAEAEIAFGQPDVESILHSSKLRWIHISSAGYARYDTAEFWRVAAQRGWRVTNSSSVYAGSCAEHVLAFLLAQSRRLPAALGSRCANGSAEWNRLRHSSVSLCHQKAVILGFGAIAAKLVELLRPFQMQLVAFRRRPQGDEGIEIVSRERLPKVLARADHIINILPDNAETAGFVSAERLAGMKPGAVLYNIGRGTTVDQTALAEALRSGRLEAAWLDVTNPEPLPHDHPLRDLPNCFITPHTAGGHRNESESLVRHFLNNFRRFLEGGALLDRIH